MLGSGGGSGAAVFQGPEPGSRCLLWISFLRIVPPILAARRIWDDCGKAAPEKARALLTSWSLWIELAPCVGIKEC